jgi:ribonuclease P protein component
LRVFFVAGESPQSGVDVAYAISRRIGGAVVRNRIRRRLRALVDGLDPLPQQGSYLIRCGNETGKLTYDELHHHLLIALERAGVL